MVKLLGPSMGMSLELRTTVATKTIMKVEQQDPTIELIGFYQRANKLFTRFTDTKGGKEVEVPFVIAPKQLIEHVKYQETYGVYLGNMIFVSENTPDDFIPLVVLKLYSERFVDEGLDRTGRIKHLKAALATIKLSEQVGGLTYTQMQEFIRVLVEKDPTGLIKCDETVRKYIKEDGQPWDNLEVARYLDAHHSNWRVSASRGFSSLLSGETQRSYKLFSIAKADIILSALDMDPYLFGVFLRKASIIPRDVPFLIDHDMSRAAFQLTKEANGFDLIRFIGETEDAKNVVIRVGIDVTWKSLVTRIEHRLLAIERALDKRIEGLKKSTLALVASLETQALVVREKMDSTGDTVISKGVEQSMNELQKLEKLKEAIRK